MLNSNSVLIAWVAKANLKAFKWVSFVIHYFRIMRWQFISHHLISLIIHIVKIRVSVCLRVRKPFIVRVCLSITIFSTFSSWVILCANVNVQPFLIYTNMFISGLGLSSFLSSALTSLQPGVYLKWLWLASTAKGTGKEGVHGKSSQSSHIGMVGGSLLGG